MVKHFPCEHSTHNMLTMDDQQNHFVSTLLIQNRCWNNPYRLIASFCFLLFSINKPWFKAHVSTTLIVAWHSFCTKLFVLFLCSTVLDISVLIKLLDVYIFSHKYVSLLISIYLTLRINSAVSKETFLLKKSPKGHAATTSMSFLLGNIFLIYQNSTLQQISILLFFPFLALHCT